MTTPRTVLDTGVLKFATGELDVAYDQEQVMVKKALYSFDATTSTSVNRVPLNSYILIEDSDGFGTQKMIYLKDLTGITAATTIADLLAATALWTEGAVLPADYGTQTLGGTAKFYLDGTTLYITTDGTTPGP